MNEAEGETWVLGQRKVVEDYLHRQGVDHGGVGDWPAFHVAPPPGFTIGDSAMGPELAALLRPRAETLKAYAADDSLWKD